MLDLDSEIVDVFSTWKGMIEIAEAIGSDYNVSHYRDTVYPRAPDPLRKDRTNKISRLIFPPNDKYGLEYSADMLGIIDRIPTFQDEVIILNDGYGRIEKVSNKYVTDIMKKYRDIRAGFDYIKIGEIRIPNSSDNEEIMDILDEMDQLHM